MKQENEFDKTNNYFCSINNNINLNNNKIINLANAENKNDLISKQHLEEILDKMFYKTLVPLQGTIPGDPIRATVVLNNTKIVNIKDPSNPEELVTLKTLSSSLPSLIPITGNNSDTLITGPIVFNNSSTITHLAPPKNDLDIINLASLKKTFAQDLSTKGGSLSGNLNANSQIISGIKDPIEPSDAVPFHYLTSLSHTSSLQIEGNSEENPIPGDLFFNNKASIYGLADPEQDTDAVNLKTLQATSALYLSNKGGSVTGNIDASNHSIVNIADPTDPSDAVNLQYLEGQKKILRAYT